MTCLCAGRSAAESLAHTQRQAQHEGWPFTIKGREPLTGHRIMGTVHCASVVGMGTNFPLVGVPAAHAAQAVSRLTRRLLCSACAMCITHVPTPQTEDGSHSLMCK